MVTSRERVTLTLNHKEPDRVPLDLGGSLITGMHVSSVYKLRQAMGLDEPGTPVKVIDPYQMLGEIKPDLIDMLGIDTVPLVGRGTMFGFKKEGWKEWTLFDQTPVLVPDGFNTIPEPNGDILQYPYGDRSAPPSGRMAKGSWYFDAIIRQPNIDDRELHIEDNLEEFGLISDDDLSYFAQETNKLYNDADKAIVAAFGGESNIGDIAFVPAPWLKNPKGIRDIEEWYVSIATRQNYLHELFSRQSDFSIANLERIYKAVGDRITVVILSGTDFGTQSGPFISTDTYRKLYKPYHKKINDWIHKHTSWKTFIHSCGSINALLGDMIDAGFDILNPVQCSAAYMDPYKLKTSFGEQITFWGGGVDTQNTLPFGKPNQVREEVIYRIKTFKPKGGFVFCAIHNIQPQIPPDNLLALFETFNKYRNY